MSDREVEKLLTQLRPACQKAGKAGNTHEQLVFLSNKVQENIHAVVCAGSGENGLQHFYQNFPGVLESLYASFS